MNFSKSFTISLLFLFSANAQAWDEHNVLTNQTLFGFKTQNPTFWTVLNATVVVTPIQTFLVKAFGTKCTWDALKDTVLEGIGRDYQIYYTDGVDYQLTIEWERGISRQHIKAHVVPVTSPHALSNAVKPIDVLSVYSDEPDWNLDDDVPQLQGKGLAQVSEGTATRMLRHFWYKGEKEWGVQFGKDQETDRRMQLYYELALIAFSVDEPYWGYRFLANALHYIQDMTQPFHTKAIINDSMIDTLSLVHARLCDWHKSDACGPQDTINAQVIKSSWIVGSYHSAYEDFVRGLLSKSARFSSNTYLSDESGTFEGMSTTEKLPWTSESMGPLIDFRKIVHAEQQAINVFAENIGELTYNTFGWRMRYDEEATKTQIMMTGSLTSEPYRMAAWFGLPEALKLTPPQKKHLPLLVDQTHQVLMRAGVWGRQFVKLTVDSLADPNVLSAIKKHQTAFQKKCTRPSSH